MANIDAIDLISKRRSLGNFGNTALTHGKVTPLTAPAINDVIRPTLVPAGTLLTNLELDTGDLDTNGTPLLVVNVGYAPVNAADGPAAVATYFATASTALQSAGRTSFAFEPILFSFDVFITITVTAVAATFASARIDAITKGDLIGVK